MADHVIRRVRHDLDAEFLVVQDGTLHVEGARDEDRAHEAVLLEDLRRIGRILHRVLARALDEDAALGNAEGNECALGEQRFLAALLEHLPARYENRQVELLCEPHGGQKARRRACRQRTLAVNVGRIGESAAAEHDDDVSLRLRGRRVGIFERTHEHVGDEIRRQEVEHCGNEHDRFRREALALLPCKISKEEKGEKKDTGR